MKGLTLQQLQDLYDASTPDVQKWMLENGKNWWERKTLHNLVKGLD